MDEHVKAFTQLSYIIARMDKNVKRRIPLDLRKAISRKKDNSYMFFYDKSLPLNKQNLLPETKKLLSVIYSEYICSDSEKEKWHEYDKFKQKLIYENSIKSKKEFKENYNSETLFVKNKNKQINVDNTSGNTTCVELIKENESILKKFLRKILNLFKL